jgi:predicted transcriptional regulator
MIKRMSNIEGHSVGDIIHSISDSKSLDLFHSIAKQSVESEVLKQTKGLTRKQYYLRIKQLLKQGLIQRNKGSFSLTCLGAIVYHAQSVIEAGVNNYWKLKAIDSIQSSAEIGEHERTKLIKTIIDDSGIESILVAQRRSR